MTVLNSRKKTFGALGLLAWPMMDQPPEEGKTMSTTCVADLLSAPVTLVVRLVFGGLSRVEFRANWSVCAEYAGMIVAPPDVDGASNRVLYGLREVSSAFSGGLPRFLCVTSTHVAYQILSTRSFVGPASTM